MSVIKNLMVRAGADFSALTTQAGKAKTTMTNMQSSVTKSCSKMTAAATGVNKALGLVGATLSLGAIVAFAKSSKEAYDEQSEGAAKLAQVMKNTMGARSDEIQSINDLITAQAKLGVVKDDVQTEASQELATYVSQSSTLKKLIPVMNDMAAQQYGVASSAESVTAIAVMMGKVMNGNTTALSRYGYAFTDAQQAILKYGTEEQRAATLAEVVEQSVGGMNTALAATPAGRLLQVSNNLENVKESFGQVVSKVSVLLIPAMNTGCTILASFVNLANRAANALSNVFGGVSTGATKAVSYAAAASAGVSNLANESVKAGKKVSSLTSFGFDTLQKLTGVSKSGEGETSANTVNATVTGGDITDAVDTSAAGESIGWLETALSKLKTSLSGISFGGLTESLGNLKTNLEPFSQGLFSGLSWAYDNIFVPLAAWTIEDALPAFLDALGGVSSVLSSALEALKPLAGWLWTDFLQPIAAWTGGVIVGALDGVASSLTKVSDWISNNQELVRGMTLVVGGFFLAWQATSLAQFLINAGGVSGIISSITAALKACTLAKLADKAETLAICALYVKDWAIALASNVTAMAKNLAAWVAQGIQWVVAKAQLIAATVAQTAHTVATWACTAATTALGVAMTILTSPITLIIAGIALLVAGVVLLIKNWDSVKAAGAAAWDWIKGAWSSAGEWFSSSIAEPVKNAWNTGMESVKKFGTNAWDNIKNAWASASGWFTNNVISPLSDGFKWFANGAIGFFEGLVNGGINGINRLIGAFNNIRINIPEWVPVIGGQTWGFNLSTVPNISLPRLANGAVFEGNNPYMAIVNDQKHGVNIESPLSTIVEAMMIALRSADFGGGDIKVNVEAVFEGQLAALARLLNPYFKAEAKRVGNSASVKGFA